MIQFYTIFRDDDTIFIPCLYNFQGWWYHSYTIFIPINTHFFTSYFDVNYRATYGDLTSGSMDINMDFACTLW